MSIEFTVWGSPIAQPRQRHRVIQAHGKVFAHNYTPKRDPVNQWKSDVRTTAVKAWDDYHNISNNHPLWDGPVWLQIWFYLPRPASRSRKKDSDGSIPCPVKPDAENLAKSVMDALSGIIYVDDRQIYELVIRKYFHEKDGRPRAEIKMGVA